MKNEILVLKLKKQKDKETNKYTGYTNYKKMSILWVELYQPMYLSFLV
jgi:hypothetical protein